jgi:hypothetical protein
VVTGSVSKEKTLIELEDMVGRTFTEGDNVVFADSYKNLRIATVRGIKDIGATPGMIFNIALDITDGMSITKKRYSRRYYPHEFYKLVEA